MTGDIEETAVILEDDECGHFDLVRVSEIPQAVARHFFFFHHRRTGDLVEGRDFRIIVPPPRCDLCGVVAEPPWWEHLCNPPLGEYDLDGLWLVCDACHALVSRKDVDGLVERSWRGSQATSPGLMTADYAPALKQAVRRQTLKVLQRFDAGKRLELPTPE